MFIHFYDVAMKREIDLNVEKIIYVRQFQVENSQSPKEYLIQVGDDERFFISELDYERCIVPLRFIEHRPYKPTPAANAAHSTKATVDEIIEAEEREFHVALDEGIDLLEEVVGEGYDDDDDQPFDDAYDGAYDEDQFDYDELSDDDYDDDDEALVLIPEMARMLISKIDKMLPSVRASEEKARGGHPELHYVTDEGGA